MHKMDYKDQKLTTMKMKASYF